MQVTLLEHRLHVLSVRAEVVPRMAFPLVRLLAQASAGDRCNRPPLLQWRTADVAQVLLLLHHGRRDDARA